MDTITGLRIIAPTEGDPMITLETVEINASRVLGDVAERIGCDYVRPLEVGREAAHTIDAWVNEEAGLLAPRPPFNVGMFLLTHQGLYGDAVILRSRYGACVSLSPENVAHVEAVIRTQYEELRVAADAGALD